MFRIARLLCRPISALVFGMISASFVPSPPNAQTFVLSDTKDLVPLNVKAEPVEYKGRKAVRLTKEKDTAKGDFDGFALLRGTDFQDGTIECDIALKITTPTGMRMPGFVGIAFRARPDASRYELFYLRPGNSQSEDRAMRNIRCNTARSWTSTGSGCAGSGHSFTRLMRNCNRRAGRR